MKTNQTKSRQFFIVNDFDRPSEQLIAEKNESGECLDYIDSEKRKHYPKMSTLRATPLEDFGVVVCILNSVLFGVASRESTATYKMEDLVDGKALTRLKSL